MRGVVSAHPSLTRVSVVAHSMGGLMARYAVGALFNPDKGYVCGLRPCHFVTMATPHCGCDADGVAQVGWGGGGWEGGVCVCVGGGGQVLRLGG